MQPKLLVIEDDDAMQSVWRIVFAGRGWIVTVASSVAEGLALLDPPPDFVILDLALPDGGGEAILRRIREAGLKTRVAITTGTNDPDQLRTVEDLGPEAAFRKPVDVADVWREAG